MAFKTSIGTTYHSKSKKRRKHAKTAKHGNKTKPYKGQGR
jgi:hypothetical protein